MFTINIKRNALRTLQRLGNFRIVYSISGDNKTIFINYVGPRAKAYE